MIPPIVVFLLWLAISPLFFALMNPRRAVLTLFVAGWLFLPKASYPLPGLPDISPSTIIAIGALIGLAVFEPVAFFRYRFRWIDLFAVMMATAPLWASLANGLGIYNGLAIGFAAFTKWCVPYFLARLVIRSPQDAAEIAMAILVGAAVYVPLCIWEMRMSPNTNHYLYGFHSFQFVTTFRFGGYRPVGFLTHGIELGMWYMVASFLGIILWQSRRIRHFRGIPTLLLLVPVLITLVLSRAMGGWVIFVIAISGYIAVRMVPVKPLLMLITLMPAIYIGARIADVWNGAGLIQVASIVSEQRASSLQLRLEQDRQLKDHALERPLFGWSGWSRNRVTSESGRDVSVTDGLWVIYLGQNGLFGLTAWLGMLLMPGIVLVSKVKMRVLTNRACLPVLGLVILMPMLVTDLLLNAFIGPSLIMISGALVGLTPAMQAMGASAAREPRRARPTAGAAGQGVSHASS